MHAIEPSLFVENGFRVVTQPLSRYSCALCGGFADVLIRTENAVELESCIKFCYNVKVLYHVFGGLSNVLIRDEGIRGVSIINRGGGICCQRKDGAVLIHADAGVMMSTLMSFCQQQGIGGFEWAAGLPGTVGGAIYGNAGASGCEIGQQTESVRLIDEGRVETLRNFEGFFDYRSSALKSGTKKGIILAADLEGYEEDPEIIRRKMDDTLEKRRLSQPHGCGTLGCAFKNPKGISAGRLIDECGLKGISCGKASVSTVHANFIVMAKGGRSADYLELLQIIQQRVKDHENIDLEPEIEVL